MSRLFKYGSWNTMLLLALLLGSIGVVGGVVQSRTSDEAVVGANMVGGEYALTWDVNAGGGSTMTSASYSISSTIGQPAIGEISSTSYTVGSGYWYMLVKWLNFLPVTWKSPS